MYSMKRLIAPLLMLVLMQGCSTTVLYAPCDRPIVSNSGVPFVYLVMLPYIDRSSRTNTAETAATSTLNVLAGLEAIAMAAQTTNVHVTLLEPAGGDCRISQVYAEFVQPSSVLRRKLLSSVIFFWGEVFTDGADRLVVQSHVRVFWNKARDQTIHARVPAGEGPVILYSAAPPYTSVSFPPRVLSITKHLGAGASSLLGGLVAREAPLETAEIRPLPPRFTIAGKKGPWVNLRSSDRANNDVWVTVEGQQGAANGFLPELSFANAMAGYISYKTAGDADNRRDAKYWLKSFREGYTDARDPLLRQSAAIADVIEGALELAKFDPDGAATTNAISLLERAVKALPSSSSVSNLAAIANLRVCCHTSEKAKHIQLLLERARDLDPGNEEIAHNLVNWYEQVEYFDKELAPIDLQRIRRRSAALSRALRN